ncbi:MAG: sulfite exporter TauE/SafE family protein [Gammaproteobacteria bacterium]|nr:sulfite exporter TauE/SafE family protein [Gammaproteobacteria bacterium]
MTADALIAAAFLAGFFGSTHCIAMCGAIVVLFEQSRSDSGAHWARRLLYNAGRLGFYALLGGIAGSAGTVVSATAGLGILRVVAGLLVIALGLNLIFDWQSTRFLERAGSIVWKRLAPLSRYVLPVNTPLRALGAGFVWGALPCGLVYSAVALAATSGSPGHGAITMSFFWLGTLPMLLLAGASGERLKRWSGNRGMRRVAGALMIAIGIYAVFPLVMPSPDATHQHHAVPSSGA